MMAACKICDDPLVIEVDRDDEGEAGGSSSAANEATVPDDLELQCGCHFHW